MGQPEGKNQFKCLGTGEGIILKGSARYGSCLDRDDLLIGWRLVSTIVKTIVNHRVA